MIVPTINYWGQEYRHGYFFYPSRNVFFCNIPKCASTSVHLHISDLSVTYDDPFYFTVIREPMERLKSALWMINTLRWEHPHPSFCPNCGYDPGSYSISSFIKEIKGIEPLSLDVQKLMHTFPQTEYIKNSPYDGDAELQIFRIDQVDEIFNIDIPKTNVSSIYPDSPVYVAFNKMFEEQRVDFKRFLDALYVEDYELWNEANK